ALKVASGFEETGIEISDVVEKENVTFRFSLIDKTTKEILPDVTNTLVYEGGKEGEIIDIKRLEVPPTVVLLLDSSGSMKGQMTATLDAAKAFIEGLPENTKIKVVDFDTEPKLLDGETKEAVLISLKKIKVGGATTLYDAILLGTTLLEEEERPTLVVFTDGQDANLNDTARGSNASYEALISELQTVNIPIYTIGFGESHDVNTLSTIAEMSEGKYYAASDSEVLTQVFHAINSKLANTYDLTYKRPKDPVRSDMPYVSIVVDTSGSMGEYSEDFGERIINVQNLLHKFIIGLPKNTQVQITEFNDETDIVQTITTDKHLLLKGVSALIAGGGTDIEGSVEA
ncbi:VWA domain-containing protein, partial [Sphaerochaeta sp. S2]|uniref:vWA domain-containing protein n=1 Tax=Sphaerochaeta sp. S2 TaxID=2798868 RepID=UPI0018E9FB79